MRFEKGRTPGLDYPLTNDTERRWEFAARTLPCPKENCLAQPGDYCTFRAIDINAGHCHAVRFQLAVDAGLVPKIWGFGRVAVLVD